MRSKSNPFPRESALHHRQHEKLEQPAVVMDGHAPLLVVELLPDLAQIEVAIAHTLLSKKLTTNILQYSAHVVN